MQVYKGLNVNTLFNSIRLSVFTLKLKEEGVEIFYLILLANYREDVDR